MRVHVHLADELVAAVDAARGDVSRSRWLVRVVEAALDETPRSLVVPSTVPDAARAARPSTKSAAAGSRVGLQGASRPASPQEPESYVSRVERMRLKRDAARREAGDSRS